MTWEWSIPCLLHLCRRDWIRLLTGAPYH
jgi:hypothetical protein